MVFISVASHHAVEVTDVCAWWVCSLYMTLTLEGLVTWDEVLKLYSKKYCYTFLPILPLISQFIVPSYVHTISTSRNGQFKLKNIPR